MARTNSQAQTGVNFDFEVKFDLEGHGQSTPKTIGILTKVFYNYADIRKTFGPLLDRRTGNHMKNQSFTGPP